MGRPYRVLITAGLIAAIVAQVQGLTHASFTSAHLVWTLIWIVIGFLLVINQLGELSKRMGERPARGPGRRSVVVNDSPESAAVAAEPPRRAGGEETPSSPTASTPCITQAVGFCSRTLPCQPF